MSNLKFNQNDPMDVALLSIHNFANDHKLTAEQVRDCFLVGARASQLFGGGMFVPSTGWQSAGVSEAVADGRGSVTA